MNPLLVQIIGGLVRVALGGVIAWLIKIGALQPGQTEEFIALATTTTIAIAWTVIRHVRDRRVKLTALVAPPGATLDEVKTIVKAGHYVPARTRDDVPTNSVTASQIRAALIAHAPPRGLSEE